VALTDSEQNICADLSAVAIFATAFGVLDDAMRQSFCSNIRQSQRTPCSWDFAGDFPSACIRAWWLR